MDEETSKHIDETCAAFGSREFLEGLKRMTRKEREELADWIERDLAEDEKDRDPLGRSDYWQKTVPKDTMTEEEAAEWLEGNIIPVSWEGWDTELKRMHSTGPIYRAGALLEGGIFIPCVAFANPYYFDWPSRKLKNRLSDDDLAILRYQLKKGSNNEISIHSIKKVVPSSYAFPKEYYDIIEKHGPVTRGDDYYFIGRMRDDTEWQFYGGTSVPLFIKYPPGYGKGHLAEVRPGILDEPSVSVPENKEKGTYGVYGYAGEKFGVMPYFWCYSDKIAIGKETTEGWIPEDEETGL